MTDLATSPTDARAAEQYCARCGYDLRGLRETRCPECGVKFDPTDLPLADVPWLHRASLGTWEAFVRTVALVLLHPHDLAGELRRNVRVPWRDAVAFRRTCGQIFSVSLCLLTTLILWRESGGGTTLAPAAMLALATVPATLLFSVVASFPLNSPGPLDPGNTIREFRFLNLHEFYAAPLVLSPLLLPLYAGEALLTTRATGPGLFTVLALLAVLIAWAGYTLYFQFVALERNGTWLLAHIAIMAMIWPMYAVPCAVAGGMALVLIAPIAKSIFGT